MAERPDFYDLIAQNRRRTWVLMFSFFVLLALVGIAVSIIVGGGLIGVMFAVTLSFGISFSSYFSSASIALTATRAKPAAREEFGRLHNLVEEVSIAAGVPKPGVYVVHDPSPNAFATGRNADNAAVAVTTGLMDKMNRAELEGVIAHEVAHIRNGDILVMTVAVATVGAIAMISDIFFRMLYWGGFTGGGASHRSSSSNNNSNGAVLLVVLARSSSLRFSPHSQQPCSRPRCRAAGNRSLMPPLSRSPATRAASAARSRNSTPTSPS